MINIVKAEGGKQPLLIDVITPAELVTTWLKIPSRAMCSFPISRQWGRELVSGMER